MIYVFLADGFEEVEALVPVDMLRRAGAEVKTVGVTGKVVTSSHNVPVTADITKEEISLNSSLELIVLPGGMPGSNNLEADETVQKAINYCTENDIFVSAICAAPKILGHKGLLKGRKATCFPGFENDLIGAELTGLPAVRDGKFITGKGAGAAFTFGAEMLKALYGTEKADDICKKMQCV